MPRSEDRKRVDSGFFNSTLASWLIALRHNKERGRRQASFEDALELRAFDDHAKITMLRPSPAGLITALTW